VSGVSVALFAQIDLCGNIYTVLATDIVYTQDNSTMPCSTWLDYLRSIYGTAHFSSSYSADITV
jgi:hypothetical protein